MTAPQLDPKRFLSRADSVALHVPASKVFGMLTRSLDLPAGWAALVGRNSGDHIVVPESGTIESADADDIMFVRVRPMDLAWQEMDVVTRDRFSCRAELTLRVAVVPERGELLSFMRRVLGSNGVAQESDILRHLKPAVRSGLVKPAAERDAVDLVGACSSEALATGIGDAVKEPCFEAGLRLEALPTVILESDAFRKVQETEQETARLRAEHRATQRLRAVLRRAQTEHVDHLESLLIRLADLAEASPDVELPELIRTFTEEQRGALYGALFAHDTSGARSRWIVVAAGDELMFFDPREPATPDRRLRVAGSAGAVRSIQTSTRSDGSTALLLGAGTGVYLLPVDAARPDVTVLVPGSPEVRGGFNSTVAAGDRILASHSELGLCEWHQAEPTCVRRRFESMTGRAKAVRHVQCFEGELFCSIDDRIIQWPIAATEDVPAHIYTGSPCAITSLCPTSRGVFAGNSEGDIMCWPSSCGGDPERVHAGNGRAAESLWMLETNGVARLVFADTSPRVRARVLGDEFSCEYEAGGQTLRRVEVGPDVIVATNDLRDRLICWTPGRPERPTATIGVSRLCGRSVQDVCIVERT